MPRIYWIRTTGLNGDMSAAQRGWTLCCEWGGFALSLAFLRRDSG